MYMHVHACRLSPGMDYSDKLATIIIIIVKGGAGWWCEEWTWWSENNAYTQRSHAISNAAAIVRIRTLLIYEARS